MVAVRVSPLPRTGNPVGEHYRAPSQPAVAEYLPVPRLSATPSLFPAPLALEVRTPKRAGAYVAQVWCACGYWQLAGTFADIPAARAAAARFAQTDPEPMHEPPGATWHKRRERRHRSGYNYVRRVKGGAWQARAWLGAEGGSLNLGLFTKSEHGEYAERAAGLVAMAFVREWRTGRTVGEVVELLKRAPKERDRVPENVVVPKCQRHLTPTAGCEETVEALVERLTARALGRVACAEAQYATDLFGASAEERIAEARARLERMHRARWDELDECDER